jgi:hypothetical protein
MKHPEYPAAMEYPGQEPRRRTLKDGCMEQAGLPPLQEAEGMEAADLSTRTCRTCTLCCRLPDIEALDKPANASCRHCSGSGCTIYALRPAPCRDFLCLWRTNAALGPEWDPLVARMMVYEQGPQTTVLVDPDHPLAWREDAYARQLAEWARDAATCGGYVIVFVGDDVFKVEA